MASDRPESEEEEKNNVIEEELEDVEEVEEDTISPELMIKHPLQVKLLKQFLLKLMKYFPSHFIL